MTISLICACKNRSAPLKIALASWLLFKEISEIIIVDWSSDESIEYLTQIDSRIKIINVPNQEYFNQPQPLNLAVSISTGDYIFKVDSDYILNPYFNFFDFYKVDSNSFLCGQNDHKEHEINSSPYFKYLRGLLFITKENYLKVGGYNETNIQYYAYEDDEIVHRLELLGLEKKKINYNHNIIHIPHSDKKRIENFEAYHTDKNLEEYYRNILSPYYEGQQLEWQIEYAIAQGHIEINRQKSLSEISDYYFRSKINWEVAQTSDQIYVAKKILLKTDLYNLIDFPRVYYVSLEESIDRQKNLEKQFLEYEIVPHAILSKRFSESNDIVEGKYLHQLNGGTVGCCVSHLKAIKQWYDTYDEEYAFFCEDDLSLETIPHWDFTWQEFINGLPSDWDIVQLLTIREDFGDFQLRERQWDDWGATAYILKRTHAKKIIDTYIKGDTFYLEIPNVEIMPLIENILFTTLGKSYTIPLFIEENKFESTFIKDQDNDVNAGQKKNHAHASKIVLDFWKIKNKLISMNDLQPTIENLLKLYSLDTENPEYNFNLGVWYESEGHTAPALSYYLRCAERAADSNPILAYESLIRGSYCYEKQGTRDGSARTLLWQAQVFLPDRPEAHFLLARFAERKQWWQDCYSACQLALTYCNFDQPSLRTDVEYPGRYGLLFEKSISGWWWGKVEESRSILLDLKNNYPLTEEYKVSVDENLVRIGVDIEQIKSSGKVHINDKKISHIFDFERHITDKNNLGYLDNFYDDLFLTIKNNPIKMMEIGVYNGGSIRLWKDYLHVDSEIYACDINYFDHIEGTCSIIGDMYTDDQSSKFSNEYFDLIIDDGPHSFESFVLLMQKYQSKIKIGGTLIIEDIINPNWVKPLVDLSLSLGYSDCKVIDMTGKQKTSELLEFWKNGLYILKITK